MWNDGCEAVEALAGYCSARNTSRGARLSTVRLIKIPIPTVRVQLIAECTDIVAEYPGGRTELKKIAEALRSTITKGKLQY